MKIPDVNILVYAHNLSSPFHKKSLAWLNKALSDTSDSVAIPTGVALGFIRSVCNPSVFPRPMAIEEACAIAVSWFDSGAVLLDGTAETLSELGTLLTKAHGGVNLIMDSYLAALAIQNRATLYSSDRDFLRFPGLKLKNPTEG